MNEFLHRTASFFIRVSAFITKEFYSVVSQPRLLAVLILGPFLILLIFGISYQNTYRTLRTIIVVEEDSSIEASVKAFTELPMNGIEVINITSNTSEALNTLERQQADMVLVIPADIISKIEGNQHAVFTFYHQEIDPFEVAYVEIVAERITEEINLELLLAAVEQSKEEARVYQTEILKLREIQENTENIEQTITDSGKSTEMLGASAVLWLLLR